jgi:putative ABC transport system ATP-binding protein
MNIISVRKASRVYRVGANEVHALRDLSLDMPKGILGALKGRSGSGKTTLLNLIGGLDQPTSGEVFLFGQPLSQLSSDQITELRRKRIGFVFQSFAIIPTFSALENVELMLRIAGIEQERTQRARRCLDIVGLGHWANHRPWELSGGQQQRVAIARALVTHPSLLLADEPTGNLATRQGEEIMTLFQELNDAGISVVMVTHEADIARHAKRNLAVRDGLVVEDHLVEDRLRATAVLSTLDPAD